MVHDELFELFSPKGDKKTVSKRKRTPVTLWDDEAFIEDMMHEMEADKARQSRKGVGPVLDFSPLHGTVWCLHFWELDVPSTVGLNHRSQCAYTREREREGDVT